MAKKDRLIKAFIFLVLIGGMGILAVLASSLSPGARVKSNIISVNLSNIAPGQTKLVGTDMPIYIVSATEERMQDLDFLSNHVWDRKTSTVYKSSKGDHYFIFYGVRKGIPSCLPKHYKKGDDNRYRTDHATWLGGFWDPCRDISYDYAGRAIKDIEYAYINFSVRVPNLPAVTAIREKDNHLFIYEGKR